MPDIPVVTPDRLGTDVSGSIIAGEEYASFDNTGRELLEVTHTNGAGSSLDLTITTTKTIDGEAVADKVLTITKGAKYLIGPFPTAIYNNEDDQVDLHLGTGYADVELQVIRPS